MYRFPHRYFKLKIIKLFFTVWRKAHTENIEYVVAGLQRGKDQKVKLSLYLIN
jgi:hypothetical protein